MTDINKLGEQVAALIKGAEKDKAQIAPMLREVWAALEARRVNGVKSEGAWAAKFGITLRDCQYLVKDGSRKCSKCEPGSTPRELSRNCWTSSTALWTFVPSASKRQWSWVRLTIDPKETRSRGRRRIFRHGRHGHQGQL